MPDWKPQEVSDVEIAFPAHALKLMPAWEEIPDKFKHMSTAHREKRTAHVTLNIEYDPAVATLDDLGDAVDLLVEHAVSGELDDSYGISTVWAGPVSGQE